MPDDPVRRRQDVGVQRGQGLVGGGAMTHSILSWLIVEKKKTVFIRPQVIHDVANLSLACPASSRTWTARNSPPGTFGKTSCWWVPDLPKTQMFHQCKASSTAVPNLLTSNLHPPSPTPPLWGCCSIELLNCDLNPCIQSRTPRSVEVVETDTGVPGQRQKPKRPVFPSQEVELIIFSSSTTVPMLLGWLTAR